MPEVNRQFCTFPHFCSPLLDFMYIRKKPRSRPVTMKEKSKFWVIPWAGVISTWKRTAPSNIVLSGVYFSDRFSWRKKCKFKEKYQKETRLPALQKGQKGKSSFTSGKANKVQQERPALARGLCRGSLYRTHIRVVGVSPLRRYKAKTPICLRTCTKRRGPGCVLWGFVLGCINLLFFFFPWLSMNSGSAAGTHFRNIKLIW